MGPSVELFSIPVRVNMPGTCSACGAPAALTCARCKTTMYCGQECQKKSWKVHKRTCQAPGSSAPSDSSKPSRRSGPSSTLASDGAVLQGVSHTGFSEEYFVRPPSFSELAMSATLRSEIENAEERYDKLPGRLKKVVAEYAELEAEKREKGTLDPEKSKARLRQMLAMIERRKGEDMEGCVLL